MSRSHGSETDQEAADWLREYALLALRVNRRVAAEAGGTVLLYRGPAEWEQQVAAEEPPPVGRLVEDAERLREGIPFPGRRAAWPAAQLTALRAVARRLAGEEPPLAAYAADCLGLPAEDLGPVPEEVFEEAHGLLDAALPAGPASGSLADRLQVWQRAHTLPPERAGELPDLILQAVAETRRRTSAAIVPLPEDEEVGCTVVPEAHFLAAGHHAGGTTSVVYVNGGVPFNLADLLYTVAHEGHPGHIAESVLKELRLVGELGRLEHQVRFLLSPPFLLGEGLGLHAERVIFPGDEAQAWLTDHVLAPRGIAPDGSDFAAIHEAKNALWGVWANACHLAAEGRPEEEVAGYLTRWCLYTEEETARALATTRAPGMGVYVLGYYRGWRLVGEWLRRGGAAARVRRLLTEPLLPADLRAETVTA